MHCRMEARLRADWEAEHIEHKREVLVGEGQVDVPMLSRVAMPWCLHST